MEDEDSGGPRLCLRGVTPKPLRCIKNNESNPLSYRTMRNKVAEMKSTLVLYYLDCGILVAIFKLDCFLILC